MALQKMLQDNTYIIYVRQTYRKVPKDINGTGFIAKLRRLFARDVKIPVFQLVINTNGVETYEEYNSHADMYNRLTKERLVRSIYFPDTLNINEFIDLGYSLRYTIR